MSFFFSSQHYNNYEKYLVIYTVSCGCLISQSQCYAWFNYRFNYFEQNERPPLPASCQPALAQLIRRCWAANPSKRPDFSDIVCTLEKYDECVKEDLPLPHYSTLVAKNVIVERLKGCVSLSSSIPVHA